jgi:sulfatase modifying factor 1
VPSGFTRDASADRSGGDATDGATPNDGTAIGRVGGACAPEAATACSGHRQTELVVCRNGKWENNGTCPDGAYCSSQTDQYAGTCRSIIAECASKAPGTLICRDGIRPDVCGPDLVDTDEPGTTYLTCKYGCVGGGICVGVSCSALAKTCGPSADESCCSSEIIPPGTFARNRDDTENPSSSATVSTFLLDRFEVTVGRFRKFVSAWVKGDRPSAGAGKHVHLHGGDGLALTAGGYETGWDTAWASLLPTTQAAWDTNLGCQDGTWTSAAGPNENLPVTCVTWHEIAAFAIWDGGFLPSQAEWNYAASGGSEQRELPWSAPPRSLIIDCTYANYLGPTSGHPCSGNPTTVGSYSPKGDGKWGNADLGGNVAEWVLDWFADPLPASCDNCMIGGPATGRIVQNGYYFDNSKALLTSHYGQVAPSTRNAGRGARIAHPWY